MIWLGILSPVISLFSSFPKITAGFLSAILIALFLKILSIAVIPFIIAVVVALIFLPMVNYLELRFKIPILLQLYQ